MFRRATRTLWENLPRAEVSGFVRLALLRKKTQTSEHTKKECMWGIKPEGYAPEHNVLGNTRNDTEKGLHVVLPQSIAGRAELARYTLRVPTVTGGNATLTPGYILVALSGLI